MPFVSFLAGRRFSTIPLRHLHNGRQLRTATLIATMLKRSEVEPHCSPGLSFETIPFGNRRCTIAHRDLTFLHTPCGGSPGSSARYWVVHPMPERCELLLVQYLPPHAQTSIHWHPKEHESFHCLLGSCVLLTRNGGGSNGSEKRFPAERYLTASGGKHRQGQVPPHTLHQLITMDEPAVNCIVIQGTSAQTLKDLDHQHVKEWM